MSNFNVFRLEPFLGKDLKPKPYQVRNYFKITLVKGNSIFHYADKSVLVQKQAIAFSNPQIPYTWEQRENIVSGYFCIFTQDFFHHFGNLNQYSIFKPNGTHIFELPDAEMTAAVGIYERMLREIDSDYTFKHDVLRTSVYDLIHLAMKLNPSQALENQSMNASQRITTLFLELLERQFPIDNLNPHIKLRSASDFAHQLSVHTNHLNRAVKAVTTKTTTQIIGERIMQEAKSLLKHSTMNVAEITYALGFEETAHFANFFKKHEKQTPLQYRNV